MCCFQGMIACACSPIFSAKTAKYKYEYHSAHLVKTIACPNPICMNEYA